MESKLNEEEIRKIFLLNSKIKVVTPWYMKDCNVVSSINLKSLFFDV